VEITSLNFALLAVASVFIYYNIPLKFRIGYLLLISCGFIATFSFLLPLYLAIYAFINFVLGQKIQTSKFSKVLFRLGIFVNITQLLLLRYASFTLDPVLTLFNSSLRISVLSDIILPVGISYYTLQGIGYLINIKMKWEKPEKNFQRFFLYIIFFPKFLSGPIERSNHFLPQLGTDYSSIEERFVLGFRQILIGLFKKMVISAQLAPYIINAYHGNDSMSDNAVWIVLFLQPLYLYFDFSGYTDIAIGYAKLFGIELLPNFNRPFLARNMTNFWKRFHISLSSWFNDYVFKQASFRLRRWGVYSAVTGLLITWFLFGIWHGAGWTFMLLGLMQGIAIIYEFFTKRWRTLVISKLPERIGIWIGRCATYCFFCIALVFFFAPDLRTVSGFFRKLAEFDLSFSLEGISTMPIMLIIYIPVILVIELLQEDHKLFYEKIEKSWFGEGRNRVFRWAVYSFIITILIIAGFKDQQFIYASF
jgi:alginate O-acetyltransferase complex protein AlgI